MAIDQIIAGVDQPTTPLMSPMQSIGGLMQLRGQMADQSLREAQMAEVRQRQQNEKLRGDQINLDQTDQKFIQALSPEDHANIYSGNLSSLYGKVQPTTLQKIQATADEHVTKLATGNKLNLENRALALTQLKDTAVNLGAPMADGKEPDAATINSRYESARAGFAPLLKLAGIESPLPASITTPEELRNIQVQLHAAEAAVIAALARKKATADAEKAKADASMATKKDAGTDAQGLTPKDRSEIDQHNAAIDNARAQLPEIKAKAAIAELESKFRATHGGLSAAEVQTGQHQRTMESIARQAKMPINAPPATIRSVIEKDEFAQEIRDTIAELKAHKGAIGVKTVVGQKALQITDPAGVKARAMLAKVGAREYHEVSGAAVTPSEDQRFKPYVPNMMDSADAAITKLEQMEKTLVSENQATREAYPGDKYRPIPKVKGDSQAGASGIPTVSSQAEFDKLPSGAEFMEDGKKYRKP